MFKKNIRAALLSFFIFSFFVVLLAPAPVVAGPDELLWGGFKDNFQTATGLGDTDIREMIGSFIRIAMGFLGIVAVIIIIMAGFKWMLSMGDEEKVGAARGMMAGGAVGLVLVLVSFGLSQFILNSLYTATGATG